MQRSRVPRLRVDLLGGFRAHVSSGQSLGITRKKAQAVLGYLAMAPGQSFSRETLAGLLWSANSDDQARQNLRQTLFALRHGLGAHRSALVLDGETVALNAAAIQVDVAAFERAVAGTTLETLEEAAALYRGDLLKGFSVKEPPFDDWVAAERARLRELALEGLRKLLARQQTKIGTTERAIQTCLRLLALDPLQEGVHRTLMSLHAREGRRTAALKQYQTCVDVLQRELGVGPEEATKQLYRELSGQRSRRVVAGPCPPNPDSAGANRRWTAPQLDLGSRDTPFVGRSTELARLREALARVWKEHGVTAVVGGEAGIGKSRLVGELGAEAMKAGGRVLIGRAYETEQILAFGVWVNAFRSGLVAEGVELASALSPVWRAELARLLPEFGDEPRAAADHRRLFEAVVQLVVLLARDQPLILVLEDLHWADEMSLRLFSFLCRRIKEVRVLAVGTVRDEELPNAPALSRVLTELGREPHVERIALSPLPRFETDKLVHNLVSARRNAEEVPRLAERVWATSEGNPFIAIEAIRAFLEEEAKGGPQASGLPQRVTDLIAGRLQRLTEPARQITALAAVIGQAFEFALLARAAELNKNTVAKTLEDLVTRRILNSVGDRFDFSHERIREVAYRQLLRPRRQILHGRVAQALEAMYAGQLERHYTALAIHCREAEAWDKAVAYFRESGRQALSRSAYREATACFEHALGAVAHLPEGPEAAAIAIDLRFDLRNSLQPLGEVQRVLDHLREAERLATASADHRRLGWVSGYISGNLWWTGDPEGAVRAGERALNVAQTCADFALRIAAQFRVGTALHALGQYQRAVALLEKTIEALTGDLVGERLGLPGLPAVLSRCCLAWSLAELGRFNEALARGREAVELAESLDHPYSLIMGCFGLGVVALLAGNPDRAIPPLERSASLSRARNIPTLSPYGDSALGFSYALSARLAEAAPLLEQGVADAEAMGFKVYQPRRIAWLAEGRLLAGRTSEAQALAERALALATEHKEAGHRAWTLRLLGEIAARREPPDTQTAAARYLDALTLAEKLEMRPLAGHCHLGLGRLYVRAANPAARQHLVAAATLFNDMVMATPPLGNLVQALP